MTILFVLVPVALGIVLLGVGAFVWATRRGQFDDLDTPALRILREEAGGPATPHLGSADPPPAQEPSPPGPR